MIAGKAFNLETPNKTRRTTLETIQEVIHRMRQQSPHKHKLTEAAMACSWKAVMPQAVCKRTIRTFYKQGKFFIQLNSAPLRQELQLNKHKVHKLLQDHTQESEFCELVFL